MVAGIGNALMAEPLARQLRAAMPDDGHLTVVAMTRPMGEPFARIRGVKVVVAGRGALKMFAALRAAAPIDLLLVPFPSNRWQYNVLAMRSGARRTIMHGYPAGARAWLSGVVAERVEAVRGLHDVNQNLRLLEPLGIQPRLDDPPRFPLDKHDRTRADDLLRDAGIDRKPFIAVHAGSARTLLAAAKRWPPANYAALIAALRSATGWPVALLEGPDEPGVAGEILNAAAPVDPEAARVIRLVGPLGEAAALLARAKLYVGTDSGLAHLASAVGTRAVTLFAPADPTRVCPFGQGDLVVKPEKPCSPCFLYPWEATRPKMRCRPPFCVTEITVEQVMRRVSAALALPGGSTVGSDQPSLGTNR